MAMALPSLLDTLLCSEERLDYDIDGVEQCYSDDSGEQELDLGDQLAAMLAKDAAPLSKDVSFHASDYLATARGGAARWAASAAASYGMSPLTALLAVAYLDRCFLTGALTLRADRPWMARLAAVACLALAAKVEETHVPPLLDIQLPLAGIGADAYVFEPKTVRRMELLVLAALDWRMHAVTAMAYIDLLLGSGHRSRPHCEALLLAVVVDWRWVQYPASLWAAAALTAAAHTGDQELPPAASEFLNGVPKEKLSECRLVMSEVAARIVGSKKRTRRGSIDSSAPPSPSAVVGACFSSDTSSVSCDHWLAARTAAAAASVSSSPDAQRQRR